MYEHTFYSPDDLNIMVSNFRSSVLKCVHLNARSVRNKIFSLEEFFTKFSFSFSVIMFSETWSTNESDVFRMKGYNTYYINRPCGRGGGTAILTLEQMDCELLDSFCIVTPDYEVLTLIADKEIYSVCYRPPNGHISTFFYFYEGFLSFVVENKYKLIAAGDYNIDMGVNTLTSTNFNNLLLSYGFDNVIKEPTRITTECESVLDIFITNLSSQDIIAGVLSCSISDHLPCSFVYKLPAL